MVKKNFIFLIYQSNFKSWSVMINLNICYGSGRKQKGEIFLHRLLNVSLTAFILPFTLWIQATEFPFLDPFGHLPVLPSPSISLTLSVSLSLSFEWNSEQKPLLLDLLERGKDLSSLFFIVLKTLISPNLLWVKNNRNSRGKRAIFSFLSLQLSVPTLLPCGLFSSPPPPLPSCVNLLRDKVKASKFPSLSLSILSCTSPSRIPQSIKKDTWALREKGAFFQRIHSLSNFLFHCFLSRRLVSHRGQRQMMFWSRKS